MQPMCPQCGINPTSRTMEITPDQWQDICDVCAIKQEALGKVVYPIEGDVQTV